MRVISERQSGRRYTWRAFTLVELMVVVVIIGILIGILIPALGTVRKQARNVATKAVLGAIETGLEMFKADGKIGGGYPPSFSDAPSGLGEVDSPYTNLPGGGVADDPFYMCGAGLLVWALAGADQLGTPGFKVFRSGSSFWSDDTDDGNFGDVSTSSGAYALRSDGLRPLQPRSGPYVDISRLQQSTWDVDKQAFVIEAEEEATTAPVQRNYPMFLDGFGFPILYWKADSAGVQMAHRRAADLVQSVDRGIYHWEDNEGLIADSGAYQLVLRPGAEDHNFDFDVASLTGAGYNTTTKLPDDDVSFARYIMNQNVQAKLSPHRADTYLLVSPGDDGVYGTGDDVANFEHNGR